MITILTSIALAVGDLGVDAPSLRSALRRLDLSSALVIASQAVDEQPAWSPDGSLLAVNIDETWSTLDLDALSLRKGTWHTGEGIGVADPPPSLARIAVSKVQTWQKAARFDPRRITTKAGTLIELEQMDLSTVFRITKKGEKPVVFWKTTLDNCHSLALAPRETMVAFICELSGVVVTVLDQ